MRKALRSDPSKVRVQSRVSFSLSGATFLWCFQVRDATGVQMLKASVLRSVACYVVTLKSLISFSEPQFPPLENRSHYLQRLF